MMRLGDREVRKADVVVIGAGVVGCAVARELARFDVRVLVLEAGSDIANGASRANSGIVHAGYDPKPGTLKAAFNIEGSRLFPQWADELGFAYRRNGSLVIARSAAEVATLHELRARGEKNGVAGLRVVDGEDARALEPRLAPEVTAALVVPTGAICDPYDVALRSLENAVANGARVQLGAPVTDVTRDVEGWILQTPRGPVTCRAVVNAAGVHADEINNAAGAPPLKISPIGGEYALYDTNLGDAFARTVFQVPTAAGKGVLVSPTVHGNLFIGPNSRPQASKEDLSTTRAGLDEILEKARATWPDLPAKGTIANFCGIRAAGESGDFVIGPAPGLPGFFNAACIDSPGLSSAPAIGAHLAREIAAFLGAGEKDAFDPRNRVPKAFRDMDDAERAAAVAADPQMGEIVCRCCEVTEAEVVRVLHGPVPALTMDAVKWRCRATMGRCHGGFCTPALLRIMSRGLGVAPETLEKRAAGSRILAGAREDYLELVRSDGDALATAAPAPPVSAPLTCDVAVVGGGAAGLAAARAAAGAGAQVVLLDREAHLGGILRQCIHSGFGLKRHGEELTGPEYAELEAAGLDGVRALGGASVLEVRPGCAADGRRHRVLLASPAGLETVDAAAVVLATGSRERGLGALNLPGDRPSGIFTAGCAQNLMNLQGCLPGRRAVVLGSGDIGLIMARRMALSGMEVAGVFEIAAVPSGLRRNIVQCLDDFGIPLTLSATVTRLEGEGRLSAVWVSDVDPATLAPVPGTERRIACDTLVLSVGLVPENEVAQTAGVALDGVTGGAVVDDALETCVPGIFACGNALHVHDLADFASAEGDVAGASAARFALGEKNAGPRGAVPVTAGEGVRYVVPQLLRAGGAGKVRLLFRVSRPVSRARFVAEARMPDGSVVVAGRAAATIAVPAEMAQVTVSRAAAAGAAELVVRVEGRR